MPDPSQATAGIAGAAGSALMGSNPIGASVQAASVIATTVSGIIDQTKRRQFEQSLSLLSNQQQNELAQKLMAANTESQRLQILSESVVEYAAANAKAKQGTQMVMYIIVGVLALGVLGAAILLSRKKN